MPEGAQRALLEALEVWNAVLEAKLDRRARPRFRIALEAQWQLLPVRNKGKLTGSAVVQDISSRAVALAGADLGNPNPGFYEVRMIWPSYDPPLQLIVSGSAVRSAPGFIVIAIEHYQFRTISPDLKGLCAKAWKLPVVQSPSIPSGEA